MKIKFIDKILKNGFKRRIIKKNIYESMNSLSTMGNFIKVITSNSDKTVLAKLLLSGGPLKLVNSYTDSVHAIDIYSRNYDNDNKKRRRD